VQLQTERLLLREFARDDWPAVLAYQSDPRYLHYYPWTERTERDAREFVGMFIEWQNEAPRSKFQLVIELEGRLIGNCGLRLDDEATGNIGYELNPDHWSLGYATEAARAICDFGFGALKLHRIWSWCLADNRASARVLEKLGMRQEGRQVKSDLVKERWRDRLLYAILESEWQFET
jgi:RimJ/RimL family protein N-acetyltransferase